LADDNRREHPEPFSSKPRASRCLLSGMNLHEEETAASYRFPRSPVRNEVSWLRFIVASHAGAPLS
jgi:hypothetical protein